MQRANQSVNVYYIHAIAGVMPNLHPFSCATNYDYSYYNTVRSLNFAGFQDDLPIETEMNRCFILRRLKKICFNVTCAAPC